MSATSFDVRTFNRRTDDVASALLTALDVKDLERREAEVTDREEAVTRREREIDQIERIHELKALDPAPVMLTAGSSESPRRIEQPARRKAFQELLRVREHEWWTKVLGVVPART